MSTAVVIGAGLGGIAAALRLRARGWQVTVCESGPTFGGKMNSWTERGFRFDTGPSLITMPWVFEDLFRVAGSRLQDHVELIPLTPLSEYFFPDGTSFTYSADLPQWLGTLKRVAPADTDGFMRFLHLGSRLYEVSKQTFLRRAPFDKPELADLRVLKDFPLRHGWGNYHDTVAAHFRSPHLRQLFDRYPTYVGSSPYLSPATLAVIPYIEYAFGGYAVRGGLYRIVEALVSLARSNGITLLADSEVTHIETNGAHVGGVQLADGSHLPADLIIMNGDAALTDKLLGTSSAPIEGRSMSGFVMLLGLKQTLPQLGQHSIYFSADYAAEFDRIFKAQRFPDDPTVYVNAPSRGDRSSVPGGEGETLFIMANAPATDEAWGVADICEARRRVFARLAKSGFPDIERDVVVSDVWTPRRIADRYHMPGGAIYGTDSHGWKNAFIRPPNRNRKVRNLYHVGGSTHPGGGTPTVLLSAQIAVEQISRL